MSNVREMYNDGPKPYKRNFIQENMKDVKKIQTQYRNQDFQLDFNSRFKKSHSMVPHIQTMLKPQFGERCTITTNNARINQLAQPKSIPNSYPHPPTAAQAMRQMSVPRGNESRNRIQFNRGQLYKNSKRDDHEIIKIGNVAEFVRRQRERNIGELEETATMSEGSSVACGSGYSSEINSPGRESRQGRDKGVQTLDADGIARLYQSGMLLYPSAKLSKLRKEMRKPFGKGNAKTALPEKNFAQNNLPEAGDSIVLRNDNLSIPELESLSMYQNYEGTKKPSVSVHAGKDYVKMNALSVAGLHKTPGPTVDPLKPPRTYQKGVLPKYLREQQQDSWQQKDSVVSSPDLVCPPGYITIPEEERLQTQKVLRESYDERIKELNRMPVRSDTLKTRQKKTQLEEELNKIEDGIKVFSKPRVFVKMSE